MMAAYSGTEHVRFLYASGKQFKWKDSDSLDGLLNLLQDEFDFTKWSLAKQDDKIIVIKETNATVNLYKSTRLCKSKKLTNKWPSNTSMSLFGHQSTTP